MPKTTKREETRRAERIRRAHATELPKMEVKDDPRRRSPGYKPPARGVARYPWATTIILLLLLAVVAYGIFTAYSRHIGPFALKPTPTPVATTSPCTTQSMLKEITDTSAAPSAADIAKIQHTYSAAPSMTINQNKVYCAGINTNRGLIVVELDPKLAPNTVNNFVFLAQHQFYDGLTFHRVLPGTIIQGGDPQGNGTGGPGYKFNDETVQGNYTAGTIAMANSGANTNGSQFFINLTDNSKTFSKNYNLFGKVVQGLDIAKKIQGPNPDGDATAKAIKPDVMNHVKVVQAP